jgi:hypothetical protein
MRDIIPPISIMMLIITSGWCMLQGIGTASRELEQVGYFLLTGSIIGAAFIIYPTIKELINEIR